MKKQYQPLTPAALYARVSSDRQDVDLSVSAQLRALKDYAKANGFSVAREYVDEAESGLVADRPQFREMIEEGSQPKAPFQVILVWKFSRFTRKREHAVAFKSMLRRKGVRVISITEHADSGHQPNEGADHHSSRRAAANPRRAHQRHSDYTMRGIPARRPRNPNDGCQACPTLLGQALPTSHLGDRGLRVRTGPTHVDDSTCLGRSFRSWSRYCCQLGGHSRRQSRAPEVRGSLRRPLRSKSDSRFFRQDESASAQPWR